MIRIICSLDGCEKTREIKESRYEKTKSNTFFCCREHRYEYRRKVKTLNMGGGVVPINGVEFIDEMRAVFASGHMPFFAEREKKKFEVSYKHLLFRLKDDFPDWFKE